jgi:hypothetical protein
MKVMQVMQVMEAEPSVAHRKPHAYYTYSLEPIALVLVGEIE